MYFFTNYYNQMISIHLDRIQPFPAMISLLVWSAFLNFLCHIPSLEVFLFFSRCRKKLVQIPVLEQTVVMSLGCKKHYFTNDRVRDSLASFKIVVISFLKSSLMQVSSPFDPQDWDYTRWEQLPTRMRGLFLKNCKIY